MLPERSLTWLFVIPGSTRSRECRIFVCIGFRGSCENRGGGYRGIQMPGLWFRQRSSRYLNFGFRDEGNRQDEGLVRLK